MGQESPAAPYRLASGGGVAAWLVFYWAETDRNGLGAMLAGGDLQ